MHPLPATKGSLHASISPHADLSTASACKSDRHQNEIRIGLNRIRREPRVSSVKPKIHHTRFPVAKKVVNLLPTCCRADLLAPWRDNKLATSRCNGIWEMTRHNRHNRLLPAPTCYGETDIMNFYSASA